MPSVVTDKDTICAVATALGRSGVGIVRVSGPKSLNVAESLLGYLPEPRHAHYGNFQDSKGRALDQGIALYFPNPHSFTGENVLELQGHGGEVVLNSLLNECLELGCRLAKPGEFSERAFLNGKMDLLQAEAIADLINSNSEQAAKSALRTLQGDFSKLIQSLVTELIKTRVEVEATIDFSDEDIDFVQSSGVVERLQQIQESLVAIFKKAQQGALLKEGMQVVIAGKPNAGKSSLLNALSGKDTAIVTDIAGTTRDTLNASIQLDGMPLHVTDTAGLRESNDVVEQEGIRRAYQAIEQADRVVLLVDLAAEFGERHNEELLKWISNRTNSEETLNKLLTVYLQQDEIDIHKIPLEKTTLVLNKIDLMTPLYKNTHNQPLESGVSYLTFEGGVTLPVIFLSAKQREGLDALTSHLKDCIGFSASEEGSFVARARHLTALRNCQSLISTALENLIDNNVLEFVAEDLRLAQKELNNITGEFSSDDLLGEIFSNFCIGK